MKVTLTSGPRHLEYIATNSKGHTIRLSGNGDAVGPMESVLMAAAGCSMIDIELILQKMRQPLEKIAVKVVGKRDEDAVPRVFKHIALHYKLYGAIKEKKANIAVEKSVKKYCSVLAMLESTVDISYSFEIIAQGKHDE